MLVIFNDLWEQVVWAFCLDLAWGDPRWLPHPVVAIGKAISFLEKAVRLFARSPLAERLAGAVVTATVVLSTYFITFFIIQLSKNNAVAEALTSILLLYTTLATRSLADHVRAVSLPLRRGDLRAARKYVSLIVGRDTERMSETEVVRATLESAAENASDGIVAPLFWAFLGGAPLAMAYKAINTLDSMIGYKNERYRYFGFFAAKLDDVVNFVPARLTALLLIVAACLQGYPCRQAWRVVLRDGRRHPSPNGGYPEAAVAGALGVRLGGPNYYQGELSVRPMLFAEGRPPVVDDITAGLGLVRLAAWLALVVGVMVGFLVKSL